MPIPKPTKEESKEKFISRCMGDETMNSEYPDQAQRAAVCNTSWRDSKKQTTWVNEWIHQLTITTQSEPKEEIMLFPFGEFEHPTYGKMTFDNDFFKELIDNYENNVLSVKPFMDRQHDENEALAWFEEPPFIRPGVGLFVRPQYTGVGNKLLKEKVYRYFSPSWGSYQDPQTGKKYKNVLFGGAATNIPFLKTMPPIVDETKRYNKSNMVEFQLTELTSDSLDRAKSDDVIDEQISDAKTINKESNMTEIIKALKLSEGASESDIVSAIAKMQNDIASLNEKINENKKEDININELNDKLAVEQEERKKLTVKLQERDRDVAINKALNEGRIKVADKEYWEKRYMSDPDNVGKDLEMLPKVIDYSEKGSSVAKEESNIDDPGAKLVDAAKKMCSEKNISFDEAVKLVCENDKSLYSEYAQKYT